MILVKDNLDNIFKIQAFDLDIEDVHMEHIIPQGDFAYFDGEKLQAAEDNPTVIMYFEERPKWNIWMVDCSVYDFTCKCNFSKNLDKCISNIMQEYGATTISKLFITHLHYDHINGIEHIIKKKYINQDTEVWMNTQYPWKQPKSGWIQ